MMGRHPWAVSGVLVGFVVVLLLIFSACETHEDDDFERQCVTAHPGAHMSKSSHVGYKSYSVTRYCLGPNGELWEVQ